MKYFDIKRYKFATIVKLVNNVIHNFLGIFKFWHFKKNYKHQILKFLDIKRIKKINFINYEVLFIHFPIAVIFFGFLYIAIPTFYNYDKSKIESIICKNKNIECLIMGKIKYNFYPTPRIIIKDLVINNLAKTKKTIARAENVVIKISIKNLLAEDKHIYKKILLNNFEANLNLKEIKNYQDILNKKINFLPLVLNGGKIVFFDGKDYVATVYNTNVNLKFVKNKISVLLKGKFLDDDIYLSFNNKKNDEKSNSEVLFKMKNLNLLTKASYSILEKDKNLISGTILIKKNKHRFTGIFDYRDNEISINKSNIKNVFLDGKIEGKIKLLPFFGFDLDVNLNSLSFTKLYNYFLNLDEKKQKKIFKINNKINGKLNFSSDKIYSKHNLVDSIESRIKFNNGSIFVDQLILNFGKLGAADLLGSINNDKKITNFVFESNIYIDNQNKFLRKLGIYNKESVVPNLFISGNIDMENLKFNFYEISNDEKLNNEDIVYVEKKFNNLMLENGYESLFDFSKFKKFIKTITVEEN